MLNFLHLFWRQFTLLVIILSYQDLLIFSSMYFPYRHFPLHFYFYFLGSRCHSLVLDYCCSLTSQCLILFRILSNPSSLTAVIVYSFNKSLGITYSISDTQLYSVMKCLIVPIFLQQGPRRHTEIDCGSGNTCPISRGICDSIWGQPHKQRCLCPSMAAVKSSRPVLHYNFGH